MKTAHIARDWFTISGPLLRIPDVYFFHLQILYDILWDKGGKRQSICCTEAENNLALKLTTTQELFQHVMAYSITFLKNVN